MVKLDLKKNIFTEKGNVKGRNFKVITKVPHEYIVYSTAEKVIGLVRLPLDGKPNKWMGLIAHVGKINALTCDSGKRRLITAGHEDLNVNIWKVDPKKLEKNKVFNLDEREPLKMYPELLEGGEGGKFYADLKNFFYYSQIRRKEENATKAHKLDGKIPLKEIQNLIIALGFYPTLQEIKNIQNEVLEMKKGQNTNLRLEEFVKLFVNHRPVYGLSIRDIAEHFQVISENEENITREDFIQVLTKYGEIFSREDLQMYLKILTGDAEIENVLPERFSLMFLLHEVFGFEIDQNVLNS
jgi:Ca2+-binding EF-hand superfamily protein